MLMPIVKRVVNLPSHMWDELWNEISYDYKLRLERALICYQFLKEYTVGEEEKFLNDLVNRKLKAYKLSVENVLVYRDEKAAERNKNI